MRRRLKAPLGWVVQLSGPKRGPVADFEANFTAGWVAESFREAGARDIDHAILSEDGAAWAVVKGIIGITYAQ